MGCGLRWRFAVVTCFVFFGDCAYFNFGNLGVWMCLGVSGCVLCTLVVCAFCFSLCLMVIVVVVCYLCLYVWLGLFVGFAFVSCFAERVRFLWKFAANGWLLWLVFSFVVSV